MITKYKVTRKYKTVSLQHFCLYKTGFLNKLQVALSLIKSNI